MTYYITSMVRRVETRMARAAAPERHRFSQYVCGGQRLIRNRPLPISEETFSKFKDELTEQHNAGILDVKVGSPEGKSVFAGDVSVPAPKPVPAPAPVEEPVEEEAQEPEDEAVDDGEPPDMSWTKAALVEHAARVLPADPAELEDLTKRQILERLEG